MSENIDYVRYGLGEHLKGKEVVQHEGILTKCVAAKYDYYDKTRKVRIVDKRTGEVVGHTQW